MGYDIEFICKHCKLELRANEIKDVITYLKEQSGPGSVTLPGGIKYGGTNYLLCGVEFIENPYEVCISACNFEMYGKKIDSVYTFTRIHCQGRWIIEQTIDCIKEVFQKYGGTLEGYFEGEDGATWGDFIIRQGKDSGVIIEKDSTESPCIMVFEEFKDRNDDLVTAFTTRLFAPHARVKEYSKKIKTKIGDIKIPIVAIANGIHFFIFIESGKWEPKKIVKLEQTVNSIHSSNFKSAVPFLVCGYEPPLDLIPIFSNKKKVATNLFLTKDEPKSSIVIDKTKVKRKTKKKIIATIAIDSMTAEDVRKFVTDTSIGLPEYEWMVRLQIGIAINSDQLIRRALQIHTDEFDNEMDFENRYNSIDFMSRLIETRPCETIREYIFSNIDSWMVRGGAGGSAIANIIRYGYQNNDKNLINRCMQWIKKEKGSGTRYGLRKGCGFKLLKNGFIIPAKSFISDALSEIEKDEKESRLMNTRVLIYEFLKYHKPELDDFLNDLIINFEKQVSYDKKETNQINALIIDLIANNHIEHAKKLFEIHIALFKRMTDDSYSEFTAWYIAINAARLNDFARVSEYAKIAIAIGVNSSDGPSYLSDYSADLFRILVEKNRLNEFESLSNELNEITPKKYSGNGMVKFQYHMNKVKIQLAISYLQLSHSSRNNQCNQKAFNLLGTFSNEILYDFIYELTSRREIFISKVALDYVGEKTTNDPDFRKKVSFHLCLGYCELYKKTGDFKELEKAMKLREETQYYPNSWIVHALIARGLLPRAIEETRADYDYTFGNKIENHNYKVETLLEHILEYYEATKNTEFLKIFLEAYNRTRYNEIKIKVLPRFVEDLAVLAEKRKNIT